MFGAKTDKILQYGEKSKVSKILPFVTSKNAQERAAAATALACSSEDESYNALITLLHDPDSAVRIQAVHSLKKIGRKGASEHIRHAYNEKSDPALVEACKDAVASLVDLAHV